MSYIYRERESWSFKYSLTFPRGEIPCGWSVYTTLLINGLETAAQDMCARLWMDVYGVIYVPIMICYSLEFHGPVVV